MDSASDSVHSLPRRRSGWLFVWRTQAYHGEAAILDLLDLVGLRVESDRVERVLIEEATLHRARNPFCQNFNASQ